MVYLSDNNINCRAGKSGESGKLLPGKFDHLEGNYEFSQKEIHRHSGKLFPGNCFFSSPDQLIVSQI